MTDKWYALALNPEPWAVGTLGIGRKGNKPYPFMAPNQKLQAYQEAVREAMLGLVGENPELFQGDVEIRFLVWRALETAKVYGARSRKAKTSDATNIQKATEDALQGLLFENDRQVRRVSTEIVEQKETTIPCIVLMVKPYVGSIIPEYVWEMVDKETGVQPVVNEGALWDSNFKAEDHF